MSDLSEYVQEVHKLMDAERQCLLQLRRAKEDFALRMYEAGFSQKEIAQAFGYTAARVNQFVKRAKSRED